ncbi:MAG: iron chelate uptake ABC transporter family permease subunit, partial [Lautropia mirabilis]|nr:iron chelate uptake ABC transporter family permease subunit [Lautropia mirabilis]
MIPPGIGVSNPVKDRFGGCRPRLLAGMLVLLALLLVAAVGSAMSGAVRIPLDAMPALLGVASDSVSTSSAAGHPEYLLWEGVLLDIRLPRILLGVLAGAALAVAGAVMQALFRNPLAEPGLVGVSVGGAVGAVGAIVLGYDQQPLVLAGAAFVGSLLATLAAWLLGRRAPGAAGILLAGIAITA